MKAKIERNGKKVFEGEYSYLEGQSKQEGKPSFFISLRNPKTSEEYEIIFSADDIKEIEKLIKSIKEETSNKLK